jgi:2-polyprenyl-6-methoxyphenol hydroxylase-like FAD-dependent oxidoreductase
MQEPTVLVVGAGPTGLALALWLTRLGIPVRIIDRTAEPGTTSRALAVQARTLEFYRQLGIADAIVAAGVKVDSLNLWTNGVRRARVPIRPIGEGLSPYPFPLVLPQDIHERLLIEELRKLDVHVERRTSLVRFEQDARSVRATIAGPDGSTTEAAVQYLAGCDGASSTVREQLGIGFPGGTYSGMFYVADVQASGAAIDQGLHVDIEDADFAIVFPLKQEGRVRLVGTVRELPAGQRDLRFEDVQGTAIAHLQLRVESVQWFSTYHVHHRVADRFWVGRAFLLGDAAHIHSPVGGQGMNTGIGDAVNLAWKLAVVLKGNARETLLETFEPERIAFARRLVATTDRAFTVVTKSGPLARLVRTAVVPRVAPALVSWRAVRRLLFRTVSQTEIEYHDSPLSEGTAGRVRGGDRLPWIPFAANDDNFRPLASIAWQVHVYGESTDDLGDRCADLNIPVHRFPWRPTMGNAGLLQGALYLIRPDGYVALADPQPRLENVRRYFAERVGYSVRSATIGSTPDARRAGA